MLLTLDDDSLHAVCDYLELCDQVRLTRVCTDLRDFVEDRFRRKCKKIRFFTEFWRAKENEIYIPIILKATEKTVENLDISGNMIMQNKDWLERMTFVNVKTIYVSFRKLEYDLEEVLPFVAQLFPNVMKFKTSGEKLDDAIGLIADLYPNLKKMKLHNQLTGKNIVKLQYLEELYVHTGNDRFDGRLFSQLLRAPRLRSLTYLRNYGFPTRLDEIRYVENIQELTIHDLDFDNLKRTGTFPLMKNLQKITVYEYPLFYTLNLEDKCFYRQLDGFSISRRYTTDLKLVVDAPKLRRIVVNRDFNILPDFCSENSKHFKSLEELYFIYSRAVEETQQNVMTVVSRSPKLRLLDISGTKFTVGFLENLMSILKWKKRTNELTLRCHKTKITHEDLQCLDLPKYLKVSFKKSDYDVPDRNTINFQIYLKDVPSNREQTIFK